MAGPDKATAEATASPLGDSFALESAETRLGGHGSNAMPIKTLDQLCTDHVRFVLELLGWNFSQSAPALGVDRRTLYRMTQRWGIARPERHPKARAAPAPLIPSEAEPRAFDGLEEGAFTEITEESERLVPGTWGETVLASGSAIASGAIRDLLVPGPGLGDFIQKYGPDDAEITRAVLLPSEQDQVDVAINRHGLAGLLNLPRPSEAPPSVPPQEFESFGHLPTLEIDK